MGQQMPCVNTILLNQYLAKQDAIDHLADGIEALVENIKEDMVNDPNDLYLMFGPEAHNTQKDHDQFLLQAGIHLSNGEQDDAALGKLFREAAEQFLDEEAHRQYEDKY